MKTRYRLHQRWFQPALVVLQVGVEVPQYKRRVNFEGFHPPPMPGEAPIGYRTEWRDANIADLMRPTEEFDASNQVGDLEEKAKYRTRGYPPRPTSPPRRPQ